MTQAKYNRVQMIWVLGLKEIAGNESANYWKKRGLRPFRRTLTYLQHL